MRSHLPVRRAAPAALAAAVAVTVIAPRLAAAGPGGAIALDAFRPALDSHGYVTVDGTGLTPPGDVAFGFYTTWAHGLLRLEGDGARYQVRDVLSPTLVGSFGVPRLPLQLGVSLPFGVVAADRDPDRGGGTPGDLADDDRFTSGAQGLGDLGVHAKLGLGRAALLASLYLPTAADDAWLGAGAVSGQLRLAVEGRRGRVRAAANLGLRLRAGGAATFMDMPTAATTTAGMPTTGERIALGAALPVGAAVAYQLAPGKLEVLAEAYALVPLAREGYTPVEALAGLKVHLARASYFTLGGGLGLGAGAGNPDARAFAAIVFEPGARAAVHVALPDPPAPRITTTDDDRDRDQILDVDDGCPDDPEDLDRVDDADGCPETDADGDRIVDDADLCATIAEDPDGLDDADGCPETDADRDRIADVDDRCPTRAESYNRVADDDGCPDNDLLSITDISIDLLKPIHFEFDSDVIARDSHTVVQAVADALVLYPHLRPIEIGGHTDSRGSAAYNLSLSRRRAASVRAFLIAAGIAPDRLTSEGYGETVPIAPGDTAAARATNRRVEFIILAP